MKELQSCVDECDREMSNVRAQLEYVTQERDDLAEQLRFAIEQANRETRAAGSLRAELLARSTIPHERLDFCCNDEHGETTAVLPRPTFVPRRGVHDEEDTLVTGEP
jgi:hypothetical protein